MPKNIYDMSSRTRMKLIKRMSLACFNCGWDKAACDIHHIISSSDGGNDDHDNLTVLCPNCHRLAHENKLIYFTTFKEKVGNKWKQFSHQKRTPKNISIKGQEQSLATRRENSKKTALELIEKVKQSGIDVTKYGWVSEFATQYGIKHQYVTRIIKKYDPDFYKKCFTRSRNGV